ncbi:MAG: hypothetical protein L0221_02070 [Chloroflexi bacterium]|nr:hypothetical protein [Chloroflexota bacterium]
MAARRRLVAAFGLSAILVAALAAPLTVAGASKPFRMNLGAPTDFVRQYDPYWCIGASMQMMLNIVLPQKADTTLKTQTALIELARTFRRAGSSPTGTTTWTNTFRPRGASGRGWAMGLTKLGAGSYKITSAPTFEAAVELIARSIRETGRPAGIVVWSGTHAWVVSGFESTVDPRANADFDVTALVVMDPWYPRSTKAYGASPKPMTTMAVKDLKKEYLPWSRPNRTSVNSGRYILLIPYERTRVMNRLVSPS